MLVFRKFQPVSGYFWTWKFRSVWKINLDQSIGIYKNDTEQKRLHFVKCNEYPWEQMMKLMVKVVMMQPLWL